MARTDVVRQMIAREGFVVLAFSGIAILIAVMAYRAASPVSNRLFMLSLAILSLYPIYYLIRFSVWDKKRLDGH